MFVVAASARTSLQHCWNTTRSLDWHLDTRNLEAGVQQMSDCWLMPTYPESWHFSSTLRKPMPWCCLAESLDISGLTSNCCHPTTPRRVSGDFTHLQWKQLVNAPLRLIPSANCGEPLCRTLWKRDQWQIFVGCVKRTTRPSTEVQMCLTKTNPTESGINRHIWRKWWKSGHCTKTWWEHRK